MTIASFDRIRATTEALAACEEVVAIAGGGSRARGVADDDSDVDLYVYVDAALSADIRSAIASRFAAGDSAFVAHGYWGDGDYWIDAGTATPVDIMYWHVAWIRSVLEAVLTHHQASEGFTTCLWHTVLHAQSLYDPSGWFASLQEFAGQPYPAGLRHAIITKNLKLLRELPFGYRAQVVAALRRGDFVSVNHRVAAFLASYFDVLWAVNGRTNPGEKRLLTLASDCDQRPAGMEADVHAVLSRCGPGNEEGVLAALDRLVDGLERTVEAAL